MKTYTLVEILGKYQHSAVDTSVFDSDRTMFYSQQLLDMLRQYSGRIHFPGDILKEIRTHNRFLVDLFQLREYNPGMHNYEYAQMINYFGKLANANGIVDKHKPYPFADVRLAAMAFTLAINGDNVAFLSSDRPLNEMVYMTATRIIGEDYPEKFPCRISGSVTPYSFIQYLCRFAEYGIERAEKKFNFSTGQ